MAAGYVQLCTTKMAMTTTPAFEAWLRACAEYLRDCRPGLALYDVDPSALRSAFAVGTVPKELLSSGQVPRATSRDPILLPFFREDVRRALETSHADLRLSDIPARALEEAFTAGTSAAEVADKASAKPDANSIPAIPSPPVSTSLAPHSRFLLGLLAGAGIVAVVAIVLLYSLANQQGQANKDLATSQTVVNSAQTSGSTVPSGPQVESSDNSGDQTTSTTTQITQTPEKKNPAPINALVPPGVPQPAVKPVAAPQVSVTSSPESRPSIDQFYATYSATGDDANPWRMTLHWKARNVDSLELLYGNAQTSDFTSPEGEITFDRDPETSGPIRPGRLFTLKGFNGNQVSTRAVAADPPP